MRLNFIVLRKKIFATIIIFVFSARAAPNETTEKKVNSLEDLCIHAQIVLESFGNACTVRNNNSSRFGKWIEISFSRKGQIRCVRKFDICSFF